MWNNLTMTWTLALVLLSGAWSISGSDDSTDSIKLPPQVDVALGEVTLTTVTLVFTVPQAEVDENTKFRVEYDGHTVTYDVRNREMPAEMRIENLRSGTTYTFRVRATNAQGTGDATDITVTTRDIRAPSPARLNSDPKGTHMYEYTAEWETPETGGLPINEYIIRYRKVAVDAAGGLLMVLEPWTQLWERSQGSKTPLVERKITDLQPLSHYQLEVTFRTDMGVSDPNDEFIFRTAYRGPDADGTEPWIASGTTSVIHGQSSILSLLLTLLLLIHCVARPVLCMDKVAY